MERAFCGVVLKRSLVPLVAIALCLATPGCGDQSDAACDSLPGSYFQTRWVYECGLDVPFCHWTVEFTETELYSTFSDVVHHSTYSCDHGVIVDTRYGVEMGTLDGSTDILTWAGYLYERGQ